MLTFNLKKEWFEKIKSGEKTHEYRLFNAYWSKRLTNAWRKYKFKGTGIPCCFACGYPAKDDKGKRLYGYITNINKLFDGLTTDLKTKEPVYDIEFELLEAENE